MAGENLKIDRKQSQENAKTTKVNHLQIIDSVFPATKPEEKQELNQIIIDSKLKLTPDLVKLFLEKAKKLSEKKQSSPTIELQRLIAAQKKNISEKIDIKQHPKLAINQSKSTQRMEKIRAEKQKVSDKEQKVSDKEQKVSDKEQKVSDKEQKVSEKIRLEKGKDKLNQEVQASLKATKDAQLKLSAEHRNHTTQQLQKRVENLPPNTLSKLKQYHIEPTDYASLLLSRDSLAGENTKEADEFRKLLSKLEKQLGAEDFTAQGLPKSHIPDYPFLEKNPDITDYTHDQSNKQFRSIESMTYLADEDWKTNRHLAMIMGSKDLKMLTEKVQDFIIFPDEQLTQEQKKLKADFNTAVAQLHQEFNKAIIQSQKDTALFAQYGYLISCLDQPTLNQENLADQFAPGKANILQIIKDQYSGADLLKVTGKTGDAVQELYCNMDATGPNLQTNSNMHYDKSLKRIVFGARKDLNMQLPSPTELSKIFSEDISPENVKEILAGSDSLEDFIKKFRQELNFLAKYSFSEEETAKFRVARAVENNRTTQDFITSFSPGADFFSERNINDNPLMKNVCTLFSNTTENLTSSELQKTRASLQKFSQLIKNRDEIQKIADPTCKDFLMKFYTFITEKKSDLSAFPKLISDFFNLFTRGNLTSGAIDPTDPNFKLNISDFSKFIDLASSKVSLESSGQLSLFSQDFRNKYEAQKSAQPDHSTADIEADLELAYA